MAETVQKLGKTQAVAVAADDKGMPRYVTVKSGRFKVASIYEQWRIANGWWANEVKRDYFRLELSNGSVCIIYHDTIGDRWYLTKKYG